MCLYGKMGIVVFTTDEKEKDLKEVKDALKKFMTKIVGETLFDEELLEMILLMEQYFPNECLKKKIKK